MAATFALLCIIWGTTWSVIQIGLQGIPPFTGVTLRFGAASILLLALCRIRRVPLGRAPHEKLLWLINALLAYSVSYGVVYWAEQWIPSGLTAVLFATYPLWVALLAPLLLPSEPLARPELIGIVVGFVGVGVIFASDLGELGGGRVLLASIVMLASPIAAAVASLAVKRLARGIHPLSLTAVPMGLTALMMAPLAFVLERHRTVVFDAVSISALAYLTVFGSMISFTLYYWLLARQSAKRLALIAYIIPIVAVLIGVLRGEPLTPQILAGSALVIAGVSLAIHFGG